MTKKKLTEKTRAKALPHINCWTTKGGGRGTGVVEHMWRISPPPGIVFHLSEWASWPLPPASPRDLSFKLKIKKMNIMLKIPQRMAQSSEPGVS